MLETVRYCFTRGRKEGDKIRNGRRKGVNEGDRKQGCSLEFQLDISLTRSDSSGISNLF
jgi:hypothetical protein